MECSDQVLRLIPHKRGWRWILETPEADWDRMDEREDWNGPK